MIIDEGIISGIEINSWTSVEIVMDMLNIVNKVLVISVNSGNVGQMYLPYEGDKIRRLVKIKDKMKFEIYWDTMRAILIK